MIISQIQTLSTALIIQQHYMREASAFLANGRTLDRPSKTSMVLPCPWEYGHRCVCDDGWGPCPRGNPQSRGGHGQNISIWSWRAVLTSGSVSGPLLATVNVRGSSHEDADYPWLLWKLKISHKLPEFSTFLSNRLLSRLNDCYSCIYIYIYSYVCFLIIYFRINFITIFI